MMAYNDVFWMMGMMFVFGLPFLLLLGSGTSPVRRGAKSGADRSAGILPACGGGQRIGGFNHWTGYGDSEVLGYSGLLLGSFLAPTILPLSSEVVLAAMVIGGFDPVACVVVASAGNSLGGVTSYFMGYVGKWVWMERLFARSRDKVDRVKAWADRYGSRAALFCWLPVVGDPHRLRAVIGRAGRRTLAGLGEVGAWQHRVKPIPFKTHQRLAKNLFRYGFDGVRRAVLNAADKWEQFEKMLCLLWKVLTSPKALLQPRCPGLFCHVQ